MLLITVTVPSAVREGGRIAAARLRERRARLKASRSAAQPGSSAAGGEATALGRGSGSVAA